MDQDEGGEGEGEGEGEGDGEESEEEQEWIELGGPDKDESSGEMDFEVQCYSFGSSRHWLVILMLLFPALRVLTLPQDLPPRLLGASISVTSKEHKGKGALTLKIPERFSTGEYLSWAISYFNRLADEDGRPFAEYEGREQPRELRAILRIYKQLNTQNR